ncbi:MAG: DUF2293 domain-containing protein [Limisphaerales bacterium]
MPTPQEADAKSDELVVFILRTEAECSECGCTLRKGNFLRVENKRPLCLDCADLGRLEYLPRGDTAVTRRATKYSALRAVVVEWSRTRKRYERQGILAVPEAIRRAEEESLADAPLRERRRVQEAARREVEDRDYVAAVTQKLTELFPGCPPDEARAIAEHACQKYSGRVGRSAAAKQLDPVMLRLAVIAHIRHEHTPYDRLLSHFADRQLARAEIRPAVERLLEQWEQSG